MSRKNPTQAQKVLDQLNRKYARLHHEYEKNFWLSYMGDHAVDQNMIAAQKELDAFRSDASLVDVINQVYGQADKPEKIRLDYWKLFFSKYQTPAKALPLKEAIHQIEAALHKKHNQAKEGYIDPVSKKFVQASKNKMRTLIQTHPDEQVRKACFFALEKLANRNALDYARLATKRNEFARLLGYKNFYEYKLIQNEGMTMAELFELFDRIYEKTKYAFKNIRKLAKKNPKLKFPWNFSYLLSGDFTKEEDPYFQFDEAIIRWGRSFAALGIDFKGGELQLDLLDRAGKHHNGFCHYPTVVQKYGRKRIAGTANFTCNAILGQVGSGALGMMTLFHEGGHAADRLNSEMMDSCVNNEYPPASIAWAETHSQFLDTLFSSIEWKTSYAKDKKGQAYPFDLFERKLRRLYVLAPLNMHGVLFVTNFERKIYTAPRLNAKKVKQIARWAYRKYHDYAMDSLAVLNVPHIYSWDSSCYYQGYGLADMAVAQWRDYFYKKYGYIVDNKNIYKEMEKVWKFGSAFTFPEYVRMATGRRLSAAPYLDAITISLDSRLSLAKKRLEKMRHVPVYKGRVRLNASIKMIHGKKVVADNKKSFETMAEKYKKWLQNIKK